MFGFRTHMMELKYLSDDRRNVSIRALRPLGSSMVHAFVGGAVVIARIQPRRRAQFERGSRRAQGVDPRRGVFRF